MYQQPPIDTKNRGPNAVVYLNVIVKVLPVVRLRIDFTKIKNRKKTLRGGKMRHKKRTRLARCKYADATAQCGTSTAGRYS